ncbi:MAG: tetratricopeptide repeat protein [bacterium]|nr:tetratricopeptide repeat protein [bacterium]
MTRDTTALVNDAATLAAALRATEYMNVIPNDRLMSFYGKDEIKNLEFETAEYEGRLRDGADEAFIAFLESELERRDIAIEEYRNDAELRHQFREEVLLDLEKHTHTFATEASYTTIRDGLDALEEAYSLSAVHSVDTILLTNILKDAADNSTGNLKKFAEKNHCLSRLNNLLITTEDPRNIAITDKNVITNAYLRGDTAENNVEAARVLFADNMDGVEGTANRAVQLAPENVLGHAYLGTAHNINYHEKGGTEKESENEARLPVSIDSLLYARDTFRPEAVKESKRHPIVKAAKKVYHALDKKSKKPENYEVVKGYLVDSIASNEGVLSERAEKREALRHPLPDNKLEGDVLRNQGALDEAIDLYKTVLDNDPNNLDALRGIGLTYLKQEEWTKAKGAFERMIEYVSDCFPEDETTLALAKNNLGAAYVLESRALEAPLKEQPGRGKRALNKVTSAFNGHDEFDQLMHNIDDAILFISELAQKSGLIEKGYQRGLSYFREARSLDPNVAETHTGLTLCLEGVKV